MTGDEEEDSTLMVNSAGSSELTISSLTSAMEVALESSGVGEALKLLCSAETSGLVGEVVTNIVVVETGFSSII